MTETPTPIRIVKRYANRKLYDTKESRYVTLDQISEMIRRGEDVKVVDNNSKDDITSVTLAQIIFEEEKKQHSFLPLSALRRIIQSGGASLHDLVNQLSESAERMGRVFRHDPTASADQPGQTGQTGQTEPKAGSSTDPGDPARLVREFIDSVQKAIDDWQKRLDSNLHHALETVSPLAPMQKELQALGERIHELERKLSQFETNEPAT